MCQLFAINPAQAFVLQVRERKIRYGSLEVGEVICGGAGHIEMKK